MLRRWHADIVSMLRSGISVGDSASSIPSISPKRYIMRIRNARNSSEGLTSCLLNIESSEDA